MVKKNKQKKLNIFRKIAVILWAIYTPILVILLIAYFYGDSWDKFAAFMVGIRMFLAAIPILFVCVMVEVAAAVQRKDKRLNNLYIPLLVVVVIILVVEVAGLVVYSNKVSKSPETSPIDAYAFRDAGFQAFEPTFLPDGFRLLTAKSRKIYIGEDRSTTVNTLNLEYTSYPNDKPTWISIDELDTANITFLTNCYITPAYSAYTFEEINNLRDCRKVYSQNGTDIYAHKLRDQYRNSDLYSEQNDYYFTKDNVWFTVGQRGEELDESVMMQIIGSLQPGKD